MQEMTTGTLIVVLICICASCRGPLSVMSSIAFSSDLDFRGSSDNETVSSDYVAENVTKSSCDHPVDIENGNWLIKSLYSDFRIGVTVLYECDEGFKAVGATEIVCQAPGYWSDYSPRCLPLDLYCAEPEPAVNGYFMCKPSHCNFFQEGTEIHHICKKNFEALPLTNLVQTCMPNGMWSGEKPHCVLVNYATTYVYSLNSNSFNSFNLILSMTCGVLGLLISFMTIVAIKRCRKEYLQFRSTSPGSQTMDYSGHCTSEDYDHETLLPCVDFACSAAPTLPTYEEATISNSSPSCSSTAFCLISLTRPSQSEFHPLPGSWTVDNVIPFWQDMALLESDPDNSSISAAPSSAVHNDNGSLETVNFEYAISASVAVGASDSMTLNSSFAVSHYVATSSIDVPFATDSSIINKEKM